MRFLTSDRIEAASARGNKTVTNSAYGSMAYSRGASALGVAVALGEIDGKVGGQCILRDFGLFSSVASTSAGIELMHNVAIVLGNSASSASPFEIGHAVMRDAIDSAAVIDALKSVGKSALETAPSRRQAVGWLTSSPRRKPRQTAASADFVTPCSRIRTSALPDTPELLSAD